MMGRGGLTMDGYSVLQLAAAIWNWVASKGQADKYEPVSNGV